MVDDEIGPESGREGAAEDFLFHLYRGSELLQDDRVIEAKQELENALAMQPRDAKGQDLLAIVYFRLGLYPRAIAIYLELIQAYPLATTPRINLALCYLKTGQPGAARTELETVIQRDPGHQRAWGYLGLAFQRLGDVERAIAAFQAGGQHPMAQRLADALALAQQATASQTATSARGLTSPERDAVSRISSEAFEELDRTEGTTFRAELSSPARLSSSGTWAAVEPGRELPNLDRKSFVPPGLASISPSDSLPPPAFAARTSGARAPDTVAPAAPSVVPEERQSDPDLHARVTVTALPAASPSRTRSSMPTSAPAPDRSATVRPTEPRNLCAGPSTAQSFAREHLLVFPRDHAVSLHATGCVLIQAGVGLAVRFDAVRAMSFGASIAARPLVKKNRSRDGEEPLGAPGAPLLAIDGAGELVLGPPAGTKLVPIALTDDLLTIRESAVVALEGDVTYEAARLPGGDGDFVSMLHLRGGGTATLALPVHCAAIEVVEGRTALLRVHAVLGWLGRVSARAVAPSESPTRTRGFVAVQGEGMVIVDGR